MKTGLWVRCGLGLLVAVSGFGCRSTTDETDRAMGPQPFADSPAPTREQSKLTDAAGKAVNQFSSRLTRELAKETDQANLLVCPMSVSLSHTMLLAGATGETRKQLADVLGFGQLEPAKVDDAMFATAFAATHTKTQQLQLANLLVTFPPMEVVPDYQKRLRRYYDADVIVPAKRDADALAQIDKWAARKTAGMIPHVFDTLNPNSMFVLANAACFIAKWQSEFDASETVEAPFTLKGGKKVRAMTMHNRRSEFEYGKVGSLTLLGLPYKDGAYEMVVMMPEDGDARRLLSTLDAAKWKSLTDSMMDGGGEVSLPKFAFDANYDLIPALKKLGVNAVFGLKAQLDKACRGPAMVTQDIHITHIEVDEKGTKAAAVTGAEATTKSSSEPVDVKIDRPFVFAIARRHSRLIVFLGICGDPTKTR